MMEVCYNRFKKNETSKKQKLQNLNNLYFCSFQSEASENNLIKTAVHFTSDGAWKVCLSYKYKSKNLQEIIFRVAERD